MHNKMSDEVVSLNVGGVIYTTTRSTLTKYPNSMLGAMFGEKFMPTLSDSKGNFFIDRDGDTFKIILNFLRAGRLCLPDGYRDLELLEAEADFYQIPDLIFAIGELKAIQNGQKDGHYVEMLDFEESAYFYRFYSDPPRGFTELKNGGLVLSGARDALIQLPLPDKTLSDLAGGDVAYRTVNISSGACSKMAILHHLNNNGWKMLSSSFANNTDSDGSYMVHKYMWYLPR